MLAAGLLLGATEAAPLSLCALTSEVVAASPGAATAGYCPPECEQTYNALTPAADVYTVGANLYQLLTGKSPLELLPPAIGVTELRQKDATKAAVLAALRSGKYDCVHYAGHAFFADVRPERYREKAAFELWPRMVSFFKTHLT